jgi:hypothetical protein
MDTRITVPEVFSMLKRVPSKRLSWAVGNRMQEIYFLESGRQPPKENRPKTMGPGSHCFALYPRSWLPRIIVEIAITEAFL